MYSTSLIDKINHLKMFNNTHFAYKIIFCCIKTVLCLYVVSVSMFPRTAKCCRIY